MAIDIFAKIGDIKGESQDAAFKDQIEVFSWSWGVSQTGSASVGGGAGAGKASFSDFSFVHNLDKASPNLFKACATGKHYPDATITARKAGEGQKEYLILKFYDLLISSVQTGGSGGEDRLTENVSINFSQVKVDYTEQAPKGAAAAKPKMGWDIAANKKI